MKAKRIVITGGPATGKSSLIHRLQDMGKTCMPEISREIILQSRKDGIDQLFLEKPLLFSELLLQGRLEQFKDADHRDSEVLFYDRGLHDVIAYLGFAKEEYPESFENICKDHHYDMVFILPPWQEIHVQDNERYEDFKTAQRIHHSLEKAYLKHGYNLIEVPKTTIEKRIDFILTQVETVL